MSERPPIRAVGRITQVHKEDQLFEVTMSNGYTAYAIVEKKGPRPPQNVTPMDCEVVTEYSPFDMTRCKVVEWRASLAD
jgi:hypothetical protein